MTWIFKKPYSYIVTKSITVTSGGTNYMLTRAPWPSGAQKYYVLRKVTATATASASGGSAVLWDQDLSNTGPAGRGSGAQPLYIIPISTVNLSGVGSVSNASQTKTDINTTPQIPFYAGITAQAPIGTLINLELEVW